MVVLEKVIPESMTKPHQFAAIKADILLKIMNSLPPRFSIFCIEEPVVYPLPFRNSPPPPLYSNIVYFCILNEITGGGEFSLDLVNFELILEGRGCSIEVR